MVLARSAKRECYMSTNSPTEMKKLISYPEQVAALDSPSVKDTPPRYSHSQDAHRLHRLHSLQLWSSLLLIICLGSLGSLSLAPYILPRQVTPSKTITIPIKKTLPASTVSVPTPIVGPFRESECTATPKSIKYLPVLSGQSVDKTLPPAWSQAGLSKKDLPYAKACAASFIVAYQTFNANNPKTFETSTSMMTDGARQRFYGTAPDAHIQPDRYMDPMWRAAMQQKNVQQTTQASAPTFLDAQYTNGRLLVWMAVLYQRSILIEGNQPVVENIQTTILLVNVPINVQKTGTGWQVSQWQDGKAVFEPPALL
jgi:hypothetical protein